ncbi:MAG: P-loop NTPase fold protein [Cyanobacteria bacterium P01_D01_bin.50]
MLSDELINAIENHNPFEGRLVVKSRDIWGTGFPDVPSLNAHASDAVYNAIEKVRSGQRQVVGITITAEKGLGKSHLISRIRHRLQADGSALFVYMSQVGDLNGIKAEFLRKLANSLKEIGSQGVSQWQELATALINEAYNQNQSYTPEQMVSQFSELLTKNPKVVDSFSDKILEIKSDIDNPDIITAILWTLSSSPRDRLNAIKWLAGGELPQSRADSMGLSNPSKEDKEAEAFNTVRQILDLISDYKPIVICFDELDVEELNDAGFRKSQVIASLGKDLYNSIKRGVLLTAMYPDTWKYEVVEGLSYAEAVVDRIGEIILELNYLNSNNVITLVSQWLIDFYDRRELTAQIPNPLFPFEEEKLRELGKEKPTVRGVLKWCAKNWKIPDKSREITPPPPPKHPVESAYNKELTALDSNVEDYIEDNTLLIKSLRFNFERLIGETLEGVEIEQIADLKAAKKDKDYIQFKIIGKEDGKTVKIGVALLEGFTGNSLLAGLRRLINYKKFDLTRGCLVRSKKVSRGTKTEECLNKLLSPALGGEWVLLKSEEIKPLLAIHSVMNSREDYELSEKEITDFIVEKRIAIDNYLIREILSDPSGEIPSEAVDEDS